jgi:hypothetical protein
MFHVERSHRQRRAGPGRHDYCGLRRIVHQPGEVLLLGGFGKAQPTRSLVHDRRRVIT